MRRAEGRWAEGGTGERKSAGPLAVDPNNYLILISAATRAGGHCEEDEGWGQHGSPGGPPTGTGPLVSLAPALSPISPGLGALHSDSPPWAETLFPSLPLKLPHVLRVMPQRPPWHAGGGRAGPGRGAEQAQGRCAGGHGLPHQGGLGLCDRSDCIAACRVLITARAAPATAAPGLRAQDFWGRADQGHR